jgi:hypothetical protein
MSATVPQSGVIPLSRAIDHYFELSLYLLVLTGFGTLASTGGLDLATVILVGSLLAVRGYFLAKRRSIVISERWTTPLTILYFIFFGADYFLFSRTFLTSTIHLALFGVVVRMFSLRRERDHFMLAILAFLMVLASAVLTVDSTFLFFFAGFMLMAVATFLLMEMKHSGLAASVQARHSRDMQEHRHMAFSLIRMAGVLMLMILAGATAVFFLLPRMSAGYLGAYSFGTDLSIGFSDRVQLGQIGQIQQSNAVVMHVEVEGDKIGAHELRWRGVALSRFDGQAWSNPHRQLALQPQWDSTFLIPPYGQAITVATTDETLHPMIHYRVMMEPIGTNVFFLAPWGRKIKGAYRQVSVDPAGAIYDIDNQRPVSSYEADSDLFVPPANQLRSAGQEYPRQVAAMYLQLPALDPRIPQLATQITGKSANNFDKAETLERYLKTHYGYTLQLPRSVLKDPLANFLFERKQGHCEYFASAMAVMLRTLGIPSRVVNGFRGDEFNDLTGNYVVRAKDAHAWVEAYFPGYGWQTFDPTPAGGSGTPQGWERLSLYVDAAASFWREWVVSYDSSHQIELSQVALSGTRGLWERTRLWAEARYEAILRWARRSRQRVEHAPGSWVGMVAAVAIFFLLLANAGRIARALHEMRLRVHPERSPEQAAAMWYQRMERSMARRGVQKPQSQTAKEFVKKIEDEPLRARVEQFTEAYESARFGNSADDAQRLPKLCEEVELAARK